MFKSDILCVTSESISEITQDIYPYIKYMFYIHGWNFKMYWIQKRVRAFEMPTRCFSSMYAVWYQDVFSSR